MPASADTSRVLTVPNLLSFARLAGIPVFLWLALGPKADGWAVILLMVSGFTDWLDGWLARKLGQFSDIGRLLDPLADRLYILAVMIALLIRDIVPLWLVAVLLARDVFLAMLLPVLRRHGYGPLQVNFLGKAATMNLLYAFPLLLLSGGTGTGAALASIFGWAFTLWGVVLYWYAGVLYTVQVRQIVRADQQGAPA